MSSTAWVIRGQGPLSTPSSRAWLHNDRGCDPDGRVEIHRLPDSQPLDDHDQLETPFFKTHVRRARILPPHGANPNAIPNIPTEAVFAEVHWADLSAIREGVLNLLFKVFAAIFSIRFFAAQGTVLPTNLAHDARIPVRWPARWLRFLLHMVATLLCGPIGAFSVFLTGVLAADFFLKLVVRAFTGDPASAKMEGPGEESMFLLSTTAIVAGFGFWLACRRWHSSSNWTRFWGSLGLAGMIALVLVSIHHINPREGFWLFLEEMTVREIGVNRRLLDQRGLGFASVTLLVIQSLFALVAVLMLDRASVLASSVVLRSPRCRAGLCAAYASTTVQLALWLLLVAPLAMLGIRNFLPQGQQHLISSMFTHVWASFIIQLVLAAVCGLIASPRIPSAKTAVRRIGKSGDCRKPAMNCVSSLLSFARCARLRIAASRESMSLPGAVHSRTSGTALSSPREPSPLESGVAQEAVGRISAHCGHQRVVCTRRLHRAKCTQSRAARAVRRIFARNRFPSRVAIAGSSLKFCKACTIVARTKGSFVPFNESSNCLEVAAPPICPNASATVWRTRGLLYVPQGIAKARHYCVVSLIFANSSAASARSATSTAFLSW